MTVLKPIENRRVVSVSTETYPLNQQCAHPECSEQAVDPHHAFPRSEIGGSSWFVQILFDDEEDARAVLGKDAVLLDHPNGSMSEPIPHCTGLCREHHDDVEMHRAWIKLEGGTWVWLDCVDASDEEKERWAAETDEHPESYPVDTWETLGELNPQPGAREGKKKRKKFQGEARRTRKTVSLRVPADAGEDGAAVLDEQVETLEEKINPGNHRPAYFTIVDALSYANLNGDKSDFGD